MGAPPLDLLAAALAGAAGSAALASLLRGGRARWALPLPGFRRQPQQASLRVVEPPHPGWAPGQRQPHPFPSDEMLQLDPAALGARMYPFVISAVVPRPIAFVCSLSSQGVLNLSPYSYFGVMSHDPPVVCIGTCATVPSEARPSGMKDSQRNITDTGEFTLNMISDWFVEAANHTCGSFDPEVDELALAGLTRVPSEKVRPPRVGESAVQLECRLRGQHEVRNRAGKVTATILIGEVVLAHANKHVCGTTPSGNVVVDLAKYAPISRAGGNTYVRTTEAFDIPRPGAEAAKRQAAL